ncbi:MAG4270 family putative restriction endonuclease [[Mycoplasma] anseris]|uniref:Uncharacterized protein n=1 Tax=[Mycoplasma] anseris TaxID=92400 RepID=A0A2Z4NCT5_9BACT|nr:hypothetical protein [[Mycoplasma] anseris]AWX69384.1 hypothetical protein DP065_01270 [[Mycoplasma] anseris]
MFISNFDKELHKIRFHFATNNYLNNNFKTGHFKGYVDVLIEPQKMLIFHREIHFESFAIDLATTESWILKENSNYQTRKSLLDFLNQMHQTNIIQTIRQDNNNLFVFNNEQLQTLNEWITNNKITFNNLIALVRGSNPSGKFKNLKAGQLVCLDFNKEEDLKNVLCNTFFDAIFLNDFVLENDDLRNFKRMKSNSAEFFLNQILKSNEKKDNHAFEFLNCLLFDEYNENKINKLKLLYIELNKEKELIDNHISKYIKLIDKERNKVNKLNIQVFKQIKEYDRAHIYEIKMIKADLIKYIYNLRNQSSINDKEIKKQFIEAVSDKENLLNLDVNSHRAFDKYMFFYDLDGNIQINKKFDNKNWNIYNQNMSIIKKIDNKFLTKKRKFYLNQRILNYKNPSEFEGFWEFFKSK